jgi:hypothetical protein
MRGYSTHPVRVAALQGRVSDLSYDASTHLFTFQIGPGRASTAELTIR